MQTKHLWVLIHIWTKGKVGAPLNWFKTSNKMFYWPFQGGTSFVDLLCLFCLCTRLFICALWSSAGKGWALGSRLWCLTVSLLLSHWYPGSGVVLDCINSWSLLPYLLLHNHNISFSWEEYWLSITHYCNSCNFVTYHICWEASHACFKNNLIRIITSIACLSNSIL